ncbi:MAG TPA: hypothetical protein DDW51_09690, partial [Cyanobacteria bacterium UBA11367]|nr:hypothetical protein [Cyanobacteria bacterium UBA11367]
MGNRVWGVGEEGNVKRDNCILHFLRTSMRPKTSIALKMAVCWLISFWSLIFGLIAAAHGILLAPLLSGMMLLVSRYAFNLSVLNEGELGCRGAGE